MVQFKRTVLVTGGTANLGYHCALDIAKQHPEYRVVVASRTDPKSAAEAINRTLHQNNVSFLPLDLSDLTKVRQFARTWDTEGFPPIQALVLNAGLQFPHGLHFSNDGIEKTFAINHVGHALLFHLLQSHLAEEARIVVTSSGTHDPAQNSGLPDAVYNTAEELAYPSPETAKDDGRQRYSSSKLANMLWIYALNRRLGKASGKKWTANAFDPGLMPGTGLAREYSSLERFLWNQIMPRILPLLRLVMFSNIHTPKESGARLARVAVGTDLEGISGKYFEGRQEIKSSIDSYDEEKQEDLWQWTVKHVAQNDAEMRKFDSLN